MILLVLIITYVGSVATIGPIHTCKMGSNDVCVFENVKLSKLEIEWEPKSDVSASSVTKIQFLNSQIPIFSYSVCQAFPALQELTIANTGIEVLRDDALHACTFLKIVNLNENKIEELSWNTFRFNKDLIGLTLAGNRLRHLYPSTFSGAYALEYLNINENNLTSFSAELLIGNNKMNTLQIEANEIGDLDEKALIKYLPDLEYIHFDLNEISCIRVVEIEKEFRMNGIIAHVSDGVRTKFRYYPQEKVRGLTCLPDISWSAANYRKSKSGTVIESAINDIEGLKQEFRSFKGHLMQLEILLREMLRRK